MTTAPPGLAALDSLSAEMDAAFPRAGNVMLMMIVATTLMNHWRSAVSIPPFLQPFSFHDSRVFLSKDPN